MARHRYPIRKKKEYDVEKILARKKLKGQFYYHIKWKNFKKY